MRKYINTKQKRFFFFWWCLLSIALLAGCGREEEDNSYYIIETESEQAFTQIKNDEDPFMLGACFYQSEPVQLMGYRGRDPETGEKYINVSLCRTSGEEETLWERVPGEYGYGSWYLDGEENGYCLYQNQVIRYDKDGGERYRNVCEDVTEFTGACMPGRGEILLLGQTQRGLLNLLKLDEDKGEFSGTGITLAENVGWQDEVFIADDGNGGFLILDSDGIWEGDTEEGRKDCIMPFTGGAVYPGGSIGFPGFRGRRRRDPLRQNTGDGAPGRHQQGTQGAGGAGVGGG